VSPRRLFLLLPLLAALAPAQPNSVTYEGRKGPGRGKLIVFIAADQEYRAEESMPALARILAERHGFTCTVLFPVNAAGEIDPSNMNNLPGLEALRRAGLMVLFARFLELPDDQMKEIIDYTNSGRPIVAFRTSTHPFNYQKNPQSPYAAFSWRSKDPAGGYGRAVLGETWVNHHGAHQKESTRGVVVPGQEKHPILRGVRDVWGESDVYTINSLSGDSQPILMGQVLAGMKPDSPPNESKKMMPIAWTKTFTGTSGKPSRIFTTTMGHNGDFPNPGFRRLAVNGVYWALGLEKKIKSDSNVDFVGSYGPSPIGTGKYKRGVKPSDLAAPSR
jgi:hypothetical protein